MSEFKSWWDFIRFSECVRRSYRFIQSDSVHAFLDTLVDTSSSRRREIAANSLLWRAQLGHSTREREYDEVLVEEPVPHPSTRMKPLRHSAHEGRINPKGIPCLYLATDKETAMSEVRPWIGTYISTAQFRTARNLTVVDFSVGHDSKDRFPFEELEKPSAEDREKSLWAQIDRAFSEPVSDDPAIADYVPTQIIAETVRRNGLDGVVYKSLLGPGFNLALFDLDAAVLVYCGLYQVESVAFSFNDEGRHYYRDDQRA
jgi:hypothetical protein